MTETYLCPNGNEQRLPVTVVAQGKLRYVMSPTIFPEPKALLLLAVGANMNLSECDGGYPSLSGWWC